MNIPTRFKLGGRTWHVKRGCKFKDLGRTYGQRCEIKLSVHNKSPEEERHTFTHELVHAICFTLGWKKLNNDEAKVDALASMLLQALTTMEYGANVDS